MMQTLGAAIGLGAPKAKCVARQVPDVVAGATLDVSPALAAGGRKLNLNDEGVFNLADNLIISLAG